MKKEIRKRLERYITYRILGGAESTKIYKEIEEMDYRYSKKRFLENYRSIKKQLTKRGEK